MLDVRSLYENCTMWMYENCSLFGVVVVDDYVGGEILLCFDVDGFSLLWLEPSVECE